jgi:hypothetical protein
MLSILNFITEILIMDIESIDTLKAEIRRLWPDCERNLCELGPLCYQLRKWSTIQARGKKGQGIKSWCKIQAIDLNHFNYLARKFTPETEKRTRLRAKPQKKTLDVIENYTNSQHPTFEQVRGLVKKALVELAVPKQFEELQALRDWVEGQLMDIAQETQGQVPSAGQNIGPAVNTTSRVVLQEMPHASQSI